MVLYFPFEKQSHRSYPLISLVPLSVDHVDLVMQWVNDPEVIKHFQNFDKKLTREDELKFIRSMCKTPYNRLFSIFDAETGVYVGQGGINAISPLNKLGRLSIFIARDHQGKGYGHSAVGEIVRKAFTELGLQKVWLMVFASNEKAQRLYRKFGFEQQGYLRNEYFWEGEYHDVVQMAVLKEDLLREKKKG